MPQVSHHFVVDRPIDAVFDVVTTTVNLSTERAHVTAPAHVPASDLVGLRADCEAAAPPDIPRGCVVVPMGT